MTRFTRWSLAALIFAVVPSAWANTEPPPAYDARSVGMGSTGVAHVHNGASLYHNPAALHGIERGAVTGVISPLAPQISAPVAVPDSEEKSARDVGPLFLVGGAYRVHDRVTLGVAAFPTMGFGADFQDVEALGGLDLTARLAVLEIAPGVAVGITDDIAVGLAYRVSYVSFGFDAPQLADPTDPTTAFQAQTTMNDWNFTGLHAGVFARVTPSTRLGLSYRSKITAELEGTTEGSPLGDLDTTADFSLPHIFKLGVAQSLLEDRLLLAADLRYALFKDANEELVFETSIPGLGTVDEVMPLDWKDSFGVYLGGEYRVHELVRARAGYSVVSSATPEETAQPILPPPGLQHTIHLGAGVAVGHLEVDLGGYYLFGGKHAEPDATSGSAPGDYHFNAILGSLGVTYRFGASAAADAPPPPDTAGGAG